MIDPLAQAQAQVSVEVAGPSSTIPPKPTKRAFTKCDMWNRAEKCWSKKSVCVSSFIREGLKESLKARETFSSLLTSLEGNDDDQLILTAFRRFLVSLKSALVLEPVKSLARPSCDLVRTLPTPFIMCNQSRGKAGRRAPSVV